MPTENAAAHPAGADPVPASARPAPPAQGEARSTPTIHLSLGAHAEKKLVDPEIEQNSSLRVYRRALSKRAEIT